MTGTCTCDYQTHQVPATRASPQHPHENPPQAPPPTSSRHHQARSTLIRSRVVRGAGSASAHFLVTAAPSGAAASASAFPRAAACSAAASSYRPSPARSFAFCSRNAVVAPYRSFECVAVGAHPLNGIIARASPPPSSSPSPD
jgi:hypothetical protein